MLSVTFKAGSHVDLGNQPGRCNTSHPVEFGLGTSDSNRQGGAVCGRFQVSSHDLRPLIAV